MKRFIVALTAVTALSALAIRPAQARDNHVAPLIAGVAIAAVLGALILNSQSEVEDAPPMAYGPQPAYSEPQGMHAPHRYPMYAEEQDVYEAQRYPDYAEPQVVYTPQPTYRPQPAYAPAPRVAYGRWHDHGRYGDERYSRDDRYRYAD